DLVLGLVLLAPAVRFLPHLVARADDAGRIRFDHHEGTLVFTEGVLEDFSRYDEAEMAAAIRQPVLVVHGALDDVVPLAAVRELFARLGSARKELWVIEGGDHRLNRPIGEVLARAEAFHAG